MPRSSMPYPACACIWLLWVGPAAAQGTGADGTFFGKKGVKLKVSVPVSGRVNVGTGMVIDQCGFSIISQSRATHKGQGIYSAEVSVADRRQVIEGSREVRVATERATCSIVVTVRASGDLGLAGSCECAP